MQICTCPTEMIKTSIFKNARGILRAKIHQQTDEPERPEGYACGQQKCLCK